MLPMGRHRVIISAVQPREADTTGDSKTRSIPAGIMGIRMASSELPPIRVPPRLPQKILSGQRTRRAACRVRRVDSDPFESSLQRLDNPIPAGWFTTPMSVCFPEFLDLCVKDSPGCLILASLVAASPM